jgi:hypothetical protein
LVTPLRHLFSDDKQYLRFISGVYHTAAITILVGLFGWAIFHVHKAAKPTTYWLAMTALLLLAASPMVGNQA